MASQSMRSMPPSMPVVSSWLISSLPHCQVVSSIYIEKNVTIHSHFNF